MSRAVVLVLLLFAAPAMGQNGLFEPDPNAHLYEDGFADRFIRRTSEDLHPINPDERVELLQYRIGN